MAHDDHTLEKGQPNGLATLDAGGKVPTSQLPPSAGTGDVVGPASATPDAVPLFADNTGKLLKNGPQPGVANGLATLDGGGKLPLAQLPAHPPAGAAGGDLAGTYPNPQVKQASEAFALNGVLSPPSFAGVQNNYAPANLATATMVRITTSADATLTGLVGGAPGRIITLFNVGTFKLSLLRESVDSAAANRFSIDNDALILPNTAAVLQYDSVSSRWRVAAVGSSVPTLLPAPKFFKVSADTTTTTQPPNWATLLSGSFSLASSETNLIVLYLGNFAVSSNNRRIETRLLLNGVSVGGSSGNGDIANIPFHVGFLGQGIGQVGNNTFEIQWRINASTARCRPISFPDDENASIAFWSSAAP